jgi:hypothetical protein
MLPKLQLCSGKHQPSVLPDISKHLLQSCHGCSNSNDLLNAHYSPPPLAGQKHHLAEPCQCYRQAVVLMPQPHQVLLLVPPPLVAGLL